MLSCEVIADLMVAYASGEASAETQRLVEEHLARCAACREAFGKEGLVEAALVELEPAEMPTNGSRFIARTRRLLFALGTGALFLFACVLVALERTVVEEIAGIVLPHLPGPELLWLAVLAFMLILYILLVFRRRRAESLLAAAPLLVVTLAAYHLMGTGSAPSVIMAVSSLLVAGGITLVLLPRLPYMTLAAVLILLLVNGLLVGSAAVGVIALGDFAFDFSALGHPAEGVTPERAVRVDLSPVGLEWLTSTPVTSVDGVKVGPPAQAVRATYEGDGRRVYLTAIAFESRQEAAAFFAAWRGTISEIRILHFETNLPGQGHVLRTYNPQTGRAYSAWQTGTWVTIIEVPGPLPQAGPLARDIKKLVATSYH